MIRDNRTTVESDLNRHHVKYEDPLWNENKETSGRIININMRKARNNSEKGYEWSFIEDGKLVFSLSGQALTKKQIRFLLSPDGITFLLRKYKDGAVNVSRLKTELKKLEL